MTERRSVPSLRTSPDQERPRRKEPDRAVRFQKLSDVPDEKLPELYEKAQVL